MENWRKDGMLAQQSVNSDLALQVCDWSFACRFSRDVSQGGVQMVQEVFDTTTTTTTTEIFLYHTIV